MGVFRPAFIIDEFDYVDEGNIGYHVPVLVDAGCKSPFPSQSLFLGPLAATERLS